jgi:hypothetical protein
MEELEKFILNSRTEMDPYNPDSGVWKKISSELGQGKRILYRLLSTAAIIIMVAGGALIIYRRSEMNNPAFVSARVQQQEIRETEIFYSNQLNSLYREAEPLLTNQPEIRHELYSDMERIDSLCTEIKKDLKDNISNQEVLEALVQNYRIKIRILEDMLTVLKENEKYTVNETQNGL